MLQNDGCNNDVTLNSLISFLSENAILLNLF